MNRAEDEPAAPAESLLSHLIELRARLLKAVLTITLVFAGLVPFANGLFTQLAEPMLVYLRPGEVLQATAMFSTVLVPYRLVFWLAVFVSMPMVIYQAWAFVSPGLYRRERRMAMPMLLLATGLFYAGVLATWFGLLPVVYSVLMGSGPEIIASNPDVNEYLDFVMVMLLGGGIAAEIPVAVAVAVLIGVVTPQQLAQARGYVVVAIFFIAAIVTPPDGLTQILLAVPMWVLFEVGLLWSRLLARPQAAA